MKNWVMKVKKIEKKVDQKNDRITTYMQKHINIV